MKLICVGKIREPYLREGIAYYEKQIRKRESLETIQVQDEMTPQGASEKEQERVKAVEGRRILSHIREKDYVVALCIEGVQTDLDDIRRLCHTVQRARKQELVFVIGGSLGLDAAVLKRSQMRMSFSAMTFPHPLMRMLLLEQLARANR